VKKKTLAILLSLAMVFSLFPVSAFASGTFPDTDKHWADGDIVILYHTDMADGIPVMVDGVETNLYFPDKNLTRAEFAKLLSRSLHLTKYYAGFDAYETMLAKNAVNEFIDVEENEWFCQDILVVKNAGIMNGFSDKSFKPEQFVTREETAQIIINYCTYINQYRDANNKLAVGTVAEKYMDDSEISDWASEAVYSLPPIQGSTGNKVMHGYPDGTFKPKGNLTRGEVSAVMVRLCERRY